MEVDLFGRLKRVLNGLFAENETGIRHRALLFIFGYSFLILLLFSVVSVAILLSSLKEEGSRQIDSYEKLFTAYVTQDVLVGRYDELFRKCRESFENTRVSRLLMEDPSGVKICDFGAENHVSSSAVREALVHFDEEKHFPAMRIQLGFDSLVPQRLVKRSAILILAFGLFLFVLSFAVSRVVVRRFFRPLEILRESLESADLHQIRTSADEVGRQGNRDIRSFAKSVGGLAKSLIDYQHRLLARERLVAFSTIATQVAHDIRSPLTALTMLTQKMEGVPESQRALLKDATQRIQDIANDLLRRHKITNDADLAEEELKAPVPVAGLIEAIVAEKRIQLRDRTIEINARIDEGSSDAVVFVDGSRIKRVLSNIIENAIEAIESAGLITVASEVADRKVRIQIRDDGKGMDKTVLANVFKRGWTYGKTGGNGLGLSYAKDVIESHNGRIEIQSEVGQGTIVMIELPRAD